MSDGEGKKFELRKGVKCHFVGVGGIGMSGLAQMCAHAGASVSGSDRGRNQPENAAVFKALAAQGVRLYDQDGSFIKGGAPDAVIYSTAIENDNPDFKCLPSSCQKVHRADALAGAMRLFDGGNVLAVTGTCGKTTVSAWIAETLFLLGKDPSFLTGGLLNRFRTPESAGNYGAGRGSFVFEADESDKSLLSYSPGWSVILNVGVDHYPEDVLLDVFARFTDNTANGVLIEKSVYDKTGAARFKKGLAVTLFGDAGKIGSPKDVKWLLTGYHADSSGAFAEINGKLNVKLPSPGRHSALNALAVCAAIDMLGAGKPEDIAEAVSEFKGVWRRFNFHGRAKSGAAIYDDYAHNPEKIVSCVSAARDICRGKIIGLFQPHGYGPFGFMKDKLFETLEENLEPNDVFALLPVFYAGGTSSFKPKSEDAAAEYQAKGRAGRYMCFGSREEAENISGEER